MKIDRRGRLTLVAGGLALLTAVLGSIPLFEVASRPHVLGVLFSGVAGGVALKAAIDEHRLRASGHDPALIGSPLLRRLRAARRRD